MGIAGHIRSSIQVYKRRNGTNDNKYYRGQAIKQKTPVYKKNTYGHPRKNKKLRKFTKKSNLQKEQKRQTKRKKYKKRRKVSNCRMTKKTTKKAAGNRAKQRKN